MPQTGKLMRFQKSYQFPKMRVFSMHNDYTLFWQTYPNGKQVMFYYAYDDTDVRQGPWTTKRQSITAARNYCNRLIKTDRMIPKQGKLLTLGNMLGVFGNTAPTISTIRKAGRILPPPISTTARR
jgi:hypothetical protein